MKNEQKEPWYTNLGTWLQNIYYIGTLVTLFLIMAQVFYAKRSIVETGEWEKAKMTIENINRFKERLSKSPLNKTEALMFSDRIWADFTNPEGRQSADTLFVIYLSLVGEDKIQEETFRLIETLDAFAYPIIMGYASEIGSFQNVAREYFSYGNYVMPLVFDSYKNMGYHTKMLYRLWRIRLDHMFISAMIADFDEEWFENNSSKLLYFEGADTSPASLKRYRRKLDTKIQEMQKEIEIFRYENLQ